MVKANQPQEDIEDRLARASAAWGQAEGSSPSFVPETPARRNIVIEFLAENWLWILVPALLVIALLGGTAIYLKMTNSGDTTTPFVYATYD